MASAATNKGSLGKKKEKKDDSVLQKLGTIGRKKKLKEEEEVETLEVEGRDAIDIPCTPKAPEVSPEDCMLDEGEERSMVVPESRNDPKVKDVEKLLKDWINDELVEQRIVVKDIQEDIYDGQVIQKLLEKLAGVRIEVPEVSQSAEGQKQKLNVVLQKANQIMARPTWQRPLWSAESIHSKNLVAILHFLVAVALHFRAPIRFPEHCTVNVIVVQKKDGQLRTRQVVEEITTTQDELGLRGERDAIDTLFDHAPDKLNTVKKSLITFVNKFLNRINLEVVELDSQFHDGVYLVLLMGLLESYFVPLYSFHLTPTTFEQKVHNVSFAFDLMLDAGLPKPKARPEDIVNEDLRSTLRVLYNLFAKYKHLS